MDVTAFIFPRRDTALAVGDYDAYRRQLTHQLASLRKKLGRSTPKNAKFDTKAAVTAEDIKSNYEFAHLLLLASERAWAHAMHIRSMHAEDQANGKITGSARKHTFSRLDKAVRHATNLLALLSHHDTSRSAEIDFLEAKAYQCSLQGALQFERDYVQEDRDQNSWNECIRQLAIARIVYNSLLRSTKRDLFQDVLSNTIDPSIRYAAYKLHVSRTVPIATVAKDHFPRDQPDIESSIRKLDPDAFSKEVNKAGDHASSVDGLPNTITWRSRTAKIADASIGQTLAAVDAAEHQLHSFIKDQEYSTENRQENSSAYDDVLNASQEVVDATRRAIEELEREGIAEGDPRMQDLRVTDLAVNYALIGWRVGRYRVLIGSDDGVSFQEQAMRVRKSSKSGDEHWIERPEGNGKKAARLRERITLYDSTLQSIDSIKELRGAARDSGFIRELDAKRTYFQALRCVNIAYFHLLQSSYLEALALFARAHEMLSNKEIAFTPRNNEAMSSPPNLEVLSQSFQVAQNTVTMLLHRYQAIVNMESLSTESAQAFEKSQTFTRPLVQRLHEHPPPRAKINLSHLVIYPPKLQPVPVKPIFLDVAFNYIDYPGHTTGTANGSIDATVDKPATTETSKPTRKGWFGFGR